LSRIGHTVVGVTSRGEDVVPLALQSQPDLVLMDIRLEGNTDGIDAAQQIRERCGILVIYLTAYADDQTLRRAGITEPFGYLLKPFESSQLRTAIEMALFKYAAERKLRESKRAALRRAQTELARVAQRTVVGELAATIAHELSQPLGAMKVSATTELRLLDADPPDLEAARSTARNIARDAQRAAEVITRIRRLFMEKDDVNATLDLNAAIQEIVALARNEIYNAGVKLRLELASDLPRVVRPRAITAGRVEPDYKRGPKHELCRYPATRVASSNPN
jgi:AmiR/NasT family two-component response regulator